MLLAFDGVRLREDTNIHLFSSIGGAKYPRDAQSFIEFYRCADKAMLSKTKDAKGCLLQFFYTVGNYTRM